ncbi:MAG: EamA family transporter [Rhodospirillales bacterium]|nr:EamA family transporter [Rhodospirillales bacterium]
MSAYWASLWAAIAISMAGQGLLKAGAAQPGFLAQIFDWHTLLGLMLYGSSALLYIIALRRIPVSVALPCSAISYVGAALMGRFLFHETIGPAHLAAIGLIIAGVGLLALS